MRDPEQPPAGSAECPSEHLEPTGHTNPLLVQPPPQKPSIGAVPDSALLKRLHDFLPQLAAANASLPTTAAPHEDPYLPSLLPCDDDDTEPTLGLPTQPLAVALDDEHSDSESDSGSGAGLRVEMDLACGVFELHSDSATEAAARVAGGAGSLGEGGNAEGDAGGALQSPGQLLRAVKGRTAADLREVPPQRVDKE